MVTAARCCCAKAAGLAGSARADAAMLRKLGFGLTAGRNLLQGPLVPGKQRAWTRPVPVEAVKAAAAATGSTVNDLMLTAITSALRRYLLEHDALADEVIVIVPVNLRPAGAPLPAGLGNQFGLAFVRLPTGETDQGRRRARVKAQMDQVKSSHEGVFVYTMLQWMGQLPAAVQNAWVDAFAGKATAIVTNVSGPPHRVQIAGTPVGRQPAVGEAVPPAEAADHRGDDLLPRQTGLPPQRINALDRARDALAKQRLPPGPQHAQHLLRVDVVGHRYVVQHPACRSLLRGATDLARPEVMSLSG